MVWNKAIFLTGMMGSGKSTVGAFLAESLSVCFIDLDTRIERIQGRSIAELFARSDTHFRSVETQALQSLAFDPGFSRRLSVVATGGGVVLDPENIEWMEQVGCSVYLQLPLEVLERRLGQDQERESRPLLAAAGRLSTVLATMALTRGHLYESCTHTVSAEGTPKSVAERIQQCVNAEKKIDR